MAALLIVPALAAVPVVTASPASAAVVADFEIDGNTPDDAVAGVDWGTPVGTHTEDEVGNVDDSNFTGGSKEFQNPTAWDEGTGTSTNQGDMSDVYSYFVSSPETWGFLGFRRIAESGTMTFMVEFNQKPNLPKETGDSTSFRPNRTANDLLLRFEQDGNGNFALTSAYKWTQSASGTFASGCFTVPGYSTPSAYCPTSISGAGFAGATGEGKLFAEAAVNLSSFDNAGDCRGAFGVMNVRSFAGDSETSSLLDFVGGIGINVPPTCGQLIINKHDQFGDPVGGATFKITPNPIPGVTGSAADELVVKDGSAADPDGVADGTVSISPAKPGTYTVEETATPAGYIPDTTVHTDVLVGNTGTSVATVAFENVLTFEPVQILNTPAATKDVDYNWQVAKSVDKFHADVPQGTSATFNYTVKLEALDKTVSGRELGGTVKLTNPNAHDMLVTLATKITGGADCAFPGVADASGAAGLQVDLTTGAHDFTYTCTPAPVAEGSTTATATWDPTTYPQGTPGATYTRSDESPFTYAVDVETDKSTTVTDMFNGGSAETLGTFDWDAVRAAAGHTVTVKTYPRTVPGKPGECTAYPNTATESADGTTDSESVTVCVGMDLDITKDATLGYHRTYLWAVDKSGPGTVFTGADAQGALTTKVRFTIDVTATDYTDSSWGLGGTIKVDNPNSWPVTGTITDTAVVDGHTLTCTVAGADVDAVAPGHQVTIPADTMDHPFTYTCAGVQKGDYVGKNTVTIDWTGAAHPSPHASASDTVDVVVAPDGSPTNKTVTLTDLLEGKNVTADLPQSSFDWPTVHAMTGNTQTLTYDVDLTTTAGACTPYTNVVAIDQQTSATDDHTVQVCSPGVTKTVNADYGRKQLWSLDKSVDKTSVEIAQGGQATFNYTVKVTPGNVVDDGTASWSGTVEVTNPSADKALTVDVTDLPAVTGWTCAFTDDSTAVLVAAGSSVALDYTCTGQGHPDGTNTATVSWDQESVDKTVDVKFTPRTGVADSTVKVYDDKTNPHDPPLLLGEADAADGVVEFTYSLLKSGVAGACTTYDNTAFADLSASPDPSDTASAELCVEKPVGVDVSADGRYGVTYPWTIDKQVDKTRVEVDAATGKATFDYTVTVKAGDAQPAGWSMGGTIKVTNPNAYASGAITLTDADVTTDVGGGAVCTATLPAQPVVPVASGGQDGDLAVPFTCTFTGQPATSGTVSATVEWDPAGAATSATSSDTGAATLTVGQETHKTVDVIDDKTDPQNPVMLQQGLTWSQGLEKSYSYSLTLPGKAGECVDHTNTAIVDLTPGAGPDVGNPQSQQTVTVCVESPLGAATSAEADLARAYAWSVNKSVDSTQRDVDASGTATFRYTVVARAGAATDSGWRMSGSVELTNSNTYADGDITADVSATSNVGGGAVCTVSGGDDVVVPAETDGSGSVSLPVTCTFTSKPGASGDLTVTAVWDPAGAADSASVSDSAPVTFVVRSETNKTVDVVDDQTQPGKRVVLEKGLVWAAGLVRTYTYDLALAGGAAGTCSTYTNTAVVDLPVGTDPSASATTSVCVPAVVAPPEVLPAQAFGKAVGNVKATCQGTVRAKLKNRSGVKVTYKLRVGKKVHRINVRSLHNQKFRTHGKARAKVTLKLGKRVLDRIRVPQRCAPPEVLPATGLRTAQVRARIDHQGLLTKGR